MATGIITLLAGVLVPLLKWIFELIAKKKLSDKEFVEYVTAYQKKKALAGKAAMSWEEALKKAEDEMIGENKNSPEKPMDENFPGEFRA